MYGGIHMRFRYPKSLDGDRLENIDRFIKLKTEMGSVGLDNIVDEINSFLDAKFDVVKNWTVDEQLEKEELLRDYPMIIKNVSKEP